MHISIVPESLVYKNMKLVINDCVPVVHKCKKATRMALKSQKFNLNGQPETVFDVTYSREI